jgi:hypothetical protein
MTNKKEKKQMVELNKTPASEDLDLISPTGRWNPRIKAYLIAAHQVHLGKSPKEIVELYTSRGVGLQQGEFFAPFQRTIRKFPLTFEKFLIDGSNKKKEYKHAHQEFANYMYNRLYYAYYSRQRSKEASFDISREHPLSHKEDSEIRQWYKYYLEELTSESCNSIQSDLQDLRNCLAMLSSFSNVIENVINRADEILNRPEIQELKNAL